MVLLLFAYNAWAAPGPMSQPQTVLDASMGLLSYQGYLTDAGGEPLHGDVDITFRLYSTPSGGTALWAEAHTGQNAVPVRDGLFNVMLGSLTPIPESMWSNGARYLGIQVSDDTEMAPRETIGSVPTALTVPNGAIGADQIADSTIKTAHIVDGAATAPKVRLSRGYIIGDTAGRTYLNTDYQTVPGLSFSVNPTTDQVLQLTITLDATKASSSGPIVGNIFVDGNYRGRPLVLNGDSIRASISSSAQINLSPGSHTIEVKALVESGSGSYLYSENSVITYMMFAQ
jgi:hypothetical protein